MAIEKILANIQTEINDLMPTLELFVQHKIHPSVNDCDSLKIQLASLQEQLAVYKHLKQNKELSPSFNIHAKVSEMQSEKIVTEEKRIVPEQTTRTQLPEEKIESKQQEIVVPPTPINVVENKSNHKKIVLGINDKFRIINELFKQNQTEFNIAVEQLNTLPNWEEAEVYLGELKHVYFWNEKNETVKLFYNLASKRFN